MRQLSTSNGEYTGGEIDSHYRQSRGPRVYINEHTFGLLFGSPNCPHLRIYPEMLDYQLEIIERHIEQAVEAGDIAREQALLVLYSEVTMAAEDAGPDGIIHFRNIRDMAKPVEEEVDVPEPSFLVNMTPAERIAIAVRLRELHEAAYAKDEKRVQEIIDDIVDGKNPR